MVHRRVGRIVDGHIGRVAVHNHSENRTAALNRSVILGELCVDLHLDLGGLGKIHVDVVLEGISPQRVVVVV